ncbi:MAG: DUF3568 family protein [Candidatus Aminicenantes bacterium]|nr:DUF3568 family protein [Candidatus Aminicenantes bacterium]
MKTTSILGIITAGLATAFLSGCFAAAVGAGAGTVAYVRGDLVVTEAAGLENVHDAALKAVHDLDLNLISQKKDALSGEITARDIKDKKIQIKLAAVTDETTKVSIRIGTFGDETKSRVIYEKIRENLGK